MRFIFSVIIGVFGLFVAQAQCKETISGDFQTKEFSTPCPVYNFAFQGEKTSDWMSAKGPLDILMVEAEILPVKDDLEKYIKDYVGDAFFSKMQFKSVDISNYDSIVKFDGRYPPVDMYACKAKYFFYYYYLPRPDIKYCIGIAIDDNKRIISGFNFPDAAHYLPEDPILDYCKVMEIVKQTGTSIEPIESVSFDFDVEKQQFLWWIKQKIVHPKEGRNERNEISIEAADSKQVVSYMKVILLDAHGNPVKKKEEEIKKTPLKKIRAMR